MLKTIIHYNEIRFWGKVKQLFYSVNPIFADGNQNIRKSSLHLQGFIANLLGSTILLHHSETRSAPTVTTAYHGYVLSVFKKQFHDVMNQLGFSCTAHFHTSYTDDRHFKLPDRKDFEREQQITENDPYSIQ